MADETCASLPSSNTALAFWQGEPGSLLRLGRDFGFRAVLTGVGLYVVGLRGGTLVKAALGASAAIESFVLIWVGTDPALNRRSSAPQLPAGAITRPAGCARPAQSPYGSWLVSA